MSARVARWLVRFAARLAPRDLRGRFVREWDAEIWHVPRPGLTSIVVGVFADAWTLNRIDHELGGSSTMRDTLAGWITDARFAVRSLLRNPAFTAVAVITLALGIGGAAAIYTVLDRVVIDPLPYPDSDRLVRIQNEVPGIEPGAVWDMSTAQYVYLADQAQAFDAIGLYRSLGANIETPSGPRRALGWRVTSEFLGMMGARAQKGRLIGEVEDRPGAPSVVVISDAFWREQFAADPDVVGKTLRISDLPAEIIGVLEPGFEMPGTAAGERADLWVPMQIDPEGYFGNNHVFSMIARLGEGVDPARAEVEMDRLEAGLPARFPDAYSTNFFEGTGFRTVTTPLKDAVLGDMAQNLWILFAAVGLVLFIACANVSNLFLVRTEVRRRELDIRSALGATRAAIARVLLAEGLVLAVASGIGALLLAGWGVPALVSIAPDVLPRSEALTRVGTETLLFTALISVLVGLGVAGVTIARAATTRSGALGAGARGSTVGRDRQHLRSALVTIQVALALTLVVGAGLLVESINRLGAVDPGVDPEGVLVARVHLTDALYDDDIGIWQAHSAMLARIRSIPGVVEAGMTYELPADGGFGCTVQGFEDPDVYRLLEDTGQTNCAGQEQTTPGYFEAMGIPVLVGRGFTEGDNDLPSRASVVVSQAFAERFWPERDAIGQGVAPSGRTEPPFYRVVGVVGDVPRRSLDGETAMAVYYPTVHNPDTPGNWGFWRPTNLALAVKTTGDDPISFAPAVRAAIAEIDASAPVTELRAMDTVIRSSIARFAFTTVLLSIAAAVALLLAAVGLFGVVSYVVGRRTREIGMRVALGAQRGQVVGLFLRRTAWLVGAGMVLGGALALLTTRTMEGLLYGVEPTDPTVFAVSAVALAVVALLGTWIPARRAARIDPVEALRGE